jgi:dihydrofolate reductase
MISIIVAIAENNAIGKDNKLLWHISEDLKRFKRITRGHTVIMGKKTYLSLPKVPLPDRRNIVITDVPSDSFEGCLTVHSIDEALEKSRGDDEVFIIGGGFVYSQFLPLADKMYITKVHKNFEADTFFPDISYDEWKLVEQTDVNNDAQNEFNYSFLTYIRK